MPVSKFAVSDSTMKSASSRSRYAFRKRSRFSEPISSSPSITKRTFTGRSPPDFRYEATAAMCVMQPALSSAVPRPNRRPSRTTGSYGGDSHFSGRPSGCTSWCP